MCNTKQKYEARDYLGFTLVELIVVIVILAILATIAFLSFNSYSSNSRDSVRLSDINNVNKSLELYNINAAKYPDPTNVYMTVVYSGGAIFEQGKLGDSVITAVQKISKKPIDPLTSKEYIYSVNMNNTAYQLKADMENKPTTGFNTFDLFNNTFADGTGTVCFIKGNFNGLIEKTNTGNTNYILAVPGLVISDTGSQAGNTNIDYNTLSGKVLCNGYNYPCIITYNPTVVFAGTGNSLPTTSKQVNTIVNTLKTVYSASNATAAPAIQTLLTSSPAQQTSIVTSATTQSAGSVSITNSPVFPGEDGILGTADDCDTDNITLGNGQVWSACNLGATTTIGWNTVPTAANTTSIPTTRNPALAGNFYQWGRNDDVTPVGAPTQTKAAAGTLAGGVGHNNFIYNSSDWITTPNDNLWGGSATTSTTGYYSGQTSANQALMQGPCPNGWHVPTSKEWCDAANNLSGVSCSSTWIAGAGTATTNGLKIAKFGQRGRNDLIYYSQGTSALFRTSTPGNYFGIQNNDILPSYNSYRTNGFSLRCLKN